MSSNLEKDWSFLVTERPERLNKPQRFESVNGSFSWAFVTAWLIEMRGNAASHLQQPLPPRTSAVSVVPVLSVQQVIDHADVNNPAIDPEPFMAFKRYHLHSVAVENLDKKKIGIAALRSYRDYTLPQYVTDVKVKLAGHSIVWDDEDIVISDGLANGPVAATIKLTQELIDYNGGIYREKYDGPNGPFTSDSPKNYHSVLVVGCGTEDGVNYWKIFNPWSNWGETNDSGIRGFAKVCRKSSCGFSILSYFTKCDVKIVSHEGN